MFLAARCVSVSICCCPYPHIARMPSGLFQLTPRPLITTQHHETSPYTRATCSHWSGRHNLILPSLDKRFHEQGRPSRTPWSRVQKASPRPTRTAISSWTSVVTMRSQSHRATPPPVTLSSVQSRLETTLFRSERLSANEGYSLMVDL